MMHIQAQEIKQGHVETKVTYGQIHYFVISGPQYCSEITANIKSMDKWIMDES